MAAVDLLAGTVMAKAASLLNDTARTVYTYAAQVPYLQIALQELQEYFELHNIPVTQVSSALINIPIGSISIAYNAVAPAPKLPDAMVEPVQLWEREAGVDPYVPMHRKDYLSHNLEGILTSQIIFYVWQDQTIKFLPSNRSNDIKIDYLKEIFTPVVDENSHIDVINASTFLEFRTAALCAEFIERNKTSSDNLNTYAVLALDRAAGINIKGKQSMTTRRRPFRSGYKKRGWLT